MHKVNSLGQTDAYHRLAEKTYRNKLKGYIINVLVSVSGSVKDCFLPDIVSTYTISFSTSSGNPISALNLKYKQNMPQRDSTGRMSTLTPIILFRSGCFHLEVILQVK